LGGLFHQEKSSRPLLLKVVGIEILFLSKQKAVLDVIPEEIKDIFEKAINEFVNAVKAIA